MLTTLRIALTAAALALLSNLIIIGFIQWRTHDENVAVLRRQVVLQATVLGDVYQSGGIAALRQAVADTADKGDAQTAVAVLDRTGKPSFGNVDGLARPSPPLSEGYRTTLLAISDEETPREAAVVLHRLRDGGWLLSGRTTTVEGLSLRQTLERSLFIAMLLSLLLGLTCGMIIAGFVERRVRAIVTVANRTDGRDLSQRVPLSGTHDAFDDLARQINGMLDRIGRLMGELRLLTDSLAHDLRSPIGRLRSAADAALATRDPDERDQLLFGLIREADGLMRMLTMVLEISRSEALTSRDQFDWFDPAELADELAEMYEPIADDARLALSVTRPETARPILGHRQLLAQAMSNLIENAIRYAPDGRTLRIDVEQQSGLTSLSVSDHGPGIAADRHAEAMRRFGRLDPSRSAEGAGLGLALVEAIAHLHDGRLVLADNAPGLLARIELPTTAAATALA